MCVCGWGGGKARKTLSLTKDMSPSNVCDFNGEANKPDSTSANVRPAMVSHYNLPIMPQ